MKLIVVKGSYSILKFIPRAKIPDWVFDSPIFFVAKTKDELSVVCESASIPSQDFQREDGWSCLKVQGPLDFAMTGVLSSIATPLAENKISLFAISTFDTDYILVKSDKFKEACAILEKSGFKISI